MLTWYWRVVSTAMTWAPAEDAAKAEAIDEQEGAAHAWDS